MRRWLQPQALCSLQQSPICQLHQKPSAGLKNVSPPLPILPFYCGICHILEHTSGPAVSQGNILLSSRADELWGLDGHIQGATRKMKPSLLQSQQGKDAVSLLSVTCQKSPHFSTLNLHLSKVQGETFLFVSAWGSHLEVLMLFREKSNNLHRAVRAPWPGFACRLSSTPVRSLPREAHRLLTL